MKPTLVSLQHAAFQDIVTRIRRELYYMALTITAVDAQSDSADTTDDVDVHNHYTFDIPHTLDTIRAVVAEHVIDAIAACNGV